MCKAVSDENIIKNVMKKGEKSFRQQQQKKRIFTSKIFFLPSCFATTKKLEAPPREKNEQRSLVASRIVK